MDTLLLSRKDIEGIIDFESAYAAARDAYKAFSSGKVVQPPIVSIEIPAHHGELDIKSGYSAMEEIIGVKTASGYPENPRQYGLESLYGFICLYDAKTSYPLCVMDSSRLTYYRTSAAGAYAATCLARKNSKVMAIIGTGGLARMHVRATAAFFPLETVYVYGNDVQQKEQFTTDLQAEYPGIRFISCSNAKDAVMYADIVSTATPSREAIVMANWIRPGTHINAFGCDMVGKQELDPELFRRAKVVVDSPDECMRRGETQHSIRLGLLKPEDVHAEIGEIALGQKAGRENDDEITIFDSVGLSIQDITIAAALYRKARQEKIGTEMQFC